MRRREFLAVAGAAAVLPHVAFAQQPIPMIAMLNAGIRSQLTATLDAFLTALKAHGFVPDQNVLVEYYFAEGNTDALPGLAMRLAQRGPAVIMAGGGAVPALAAKAAAPNTPIVFTSGTDPVAAGLVESVNRPGGNVTGSYFLTQEIDAKRLEVLHELVPSARRIGVLHNPKGMPPPPVIVSAEKLGLELSLVPASSEAEIEAAFTAFATAGVDAVLQASDPAFASWRGRITAAAARVAIPSIYETRNFVLEGGLASYGINAIEAYRLAGDYVGQILRGAKPADLPVVVPSRYEMFVNLKTAKALGITIPTSILLRADQVVE